MADDNIKRMIFKVVIENVWCYEFTIQVILIEESYGILYSALWDIYAEGTAAHLREGSQVASLPTSNFQYTHPFVNAFVILDKWNKLVTTCCR